MAKNNEKKPSQTSKNTEEKKLKDAFYSYVSKSSGCYDEEFANQIKALKSDWLVEDKVNVNKQKLLEMAKNGGEKPSRYSKNTEEKKLGSALSTYIKKSSGVYDEEFTNQIKKTRPDWFLKTNISVENKQKLLEMAKNKENRPNRKSKNTEEKKLGSALSTYTNKSENSYDEEFTNKIKMLRPDWFSRKKSKC